MTLTISNSFKIQDYVEGNYDIQNSPFGLKAEEFFELGVRINPKRSFLFVNKLLGKHLAVHPQIPRLTGLLLAHQYAVSKGIPSPFSADLLVSMIRNPKDYSPADYQFLYTIDWKLPHKVLFIGFCETATGLGHATFSPFSNATYLHTTREDFTDYLPSQFDFQEEHSHATGHFAFAQDPSIFEVDEIVLVDDEVTTGKTALNLIEALSNKFAVQKFTILSLLDWRNETHRQIAKQKGVELGLSITFEALASGEFEVIKDEPIKAWHLPVPSKENHPIETNSIIYNHRSLPTIFLGWHFSPSYTGRFGIRSDINRKIEVAALDLAEELIPYRKTKGKALVMGHGEFIYFPSRVASYMGNGYTFKSSTRSPILPLQEENYPIQDRVCFDLDKGERYFTYNLKKDQVKEVFYLSENSLNSNNKTRIAQCFAQQGITSIHFVECM